MAEINKSNPFPAKIKVRERLTKDGSTKETFHIVLDLEGSGMHFKVGDSIGIFAQNNRIVVEKALQKLGLSGSETITDHRSGRLFSMREFLATKVNLSRLGTKESLETAYAPLLPRFYSIASSPNTHPGEVHLTVVVSTYEEEGELRFGVASHFLCHLAEVNATSIPCFVLSTPHFTIPHDDERHIIMIGPGTGVAPFRGFVQERLARAAKGKNWLFFGERSRGTDFFYEDFWSSLVDQGHLKLDLAFSRDQAEKVYVQHKMVENGLELWQWLQEGAHFYVCGDADPMAKEVEAAFIQIAQEHGKMSAQEAGVYLKALRKEKRYLIDVY